MAIGGSRWLVVVAALAMSHQLTLDVDSTLVVHGDRGRLTQVFANLLTNAAKYTNAEGRIDVVARATGHGSRWISRH